MPSHALPLLASTNDAQIILTCISLLHIPMSEKIGQPSSSSSQDDTAEQICATLRLPDAARSKDFGASWMEVCHKWGFEIVRERVVYVGRNGKAKEFTQEHFVVSVVRPHGSASDLADRSPARRAGLKVGDVLVSLAGKPNLSPKDLYTLLKGTLDELQICVQRQKNGKGDRSSAAKGNLVAAPAALAATRRERVTVQIPKTEVYTSSGEEVGETDVKLDPNDSDNRPMHESGGSSIDGQDSSATVPAQASSNQQPDASQRALKPAPDVGPGWKIFEVERKGSIKTKGRVDRYWVSPSGKKFRSGKEIERYQETLKATNGDEKAAWSAAKSPSRTKASSVRVGSVTARASTSIGDTKNGNLHPDLLRLIDLHEDWDTAGNKKKSLLNGYIYNCEGGKCVHIESANIVDVAEILCQTRPHINNGTINADPDQVLIEANKLCKEAREEEAFFLQSLQDEISRADEGPVGSASASALTPTKEEAKEDNNANMKEECKGRKEETNNQESSEASSQSLQAEAIEMPIEEKNLQSSAQHTSTAPAGSRPRSESQSEAKAKPSIASSSGVAFGAKKIGSGSSKNTRQKRLWPDSFIFRKRVMKWCPPDVVKQAGGPVRFLGPLRQQTQSRGASVDASNEADVPRNAETQSTALAPIPSTIHTVAEMLKVMSPHILEEGRAQVNRDYEEHSDSDSFWTRTTYEASLVTCTPVERKTSSSSAQRVYEFGFHLSQKDVSRIQNNIDDLFVIHASKWDSIACIGMIGPRDEHTTTYLKDQRHRDGPQADFRLWITASKDPCDGTGWLVQSDVPAVVPGGGIESQRAFIMHIGSASDIMRQYEGMKSLSFVKDHLQRAVFCSGDTNKRNRAVSMDSIGATGAGAATSALDKPATIPDYVWRKICASLNQIQLRSIHRIMEGKSRENVALLQGPPGTGKTTTICHLVSALLNGACPKPGSKMAGVRVHIGKSISTASSKGDKGTKALNRAANRILVCAASNAAVDELAWKIHKHSIAGDGRSGVTKITRYGFLPWERAGDKGDPQLSRNSGSERDRFLAKFNYDAQVSNAQHRKLLSDCDVVCATLSGLGSKGFIDAVSKDESNTGSEFDAIIIDEACQATEAACLIPLKYNPNLLVLVGDPQQLPAFVASQECEKNMFGRSLFERLQEQGWGVDMLHIQYRMHESIVDFPSVFYGNKLVTSDTVKNRPPARWHSHRCFPPLLVWNLEQPMQRGDIGGLSNRSEANFICNKLLREFLHSHGASSPRQIRIGIISFYSSQVKLIKQLLPKDKRGNVSFEVSTVDGFQGRETDIIIISCVRSFDANRRGKFGNLGFLQDFRRVNVALTRARESLWIVGNCNFLAKNAVWKEMLDRAADRKLIASPHDFDRLAPFPSRGNHHNTNNGNSGNKRKRGRRGRGGKDSPDKGTDPPKRKRNDK